LVQVYESNGNQIIPLSINVVNSGTVVVTFSTSTAGRAVVSSGLSGTSGTSGTSGDSNARIQTWNLSNSYVSGTTVTNNGIIYRANNNISSGTTFSLGTTGTTWTQLAADANATYSSGKTYSQGALVVNNNGLIYQANNNISSGTTFSVGTTGSTWNQISGLPSQVFNLPSSATVTWVLLGTWNTIQQGATLYSRIVSHAGYNATTTQNQVTELYFKTSNGVSSQPGVSGGTFFGDALAYTNRALGPTFTTPETIRIVQISNTQYQVYGFFNAGFIDNSTYHIQITSGTTWTNSGTLVSAPTGTFINVTPNAGTTPGIREYRRSQQFNLSNSTDVLIDWDILDTDSIQNLTEVSGVFTNTANYTRTFIFDYQAGAGTSSNIIEHNLFITKNGTPTGANRIAANVINPVNNALALHRCTATITMAPNDTIRCYEYVTSVNAGVWQTSPGIFGMDAGRTTRLTITEI
jgi:hypothetical protein